MKKLNPSEHAYAEHARQVHRVSPAEGTKFEELFDPAYWSHISSKLHKGDLIEVLPADDAYFAELLVVSCSKVHAKVKVLRHAKLEEAKQPAKNADKGSDEPFSVEFKGPQRKWSVIRKADKAVVKEEFASKDEANVWLEANKSNLLA